MRRVALAACLLAAGCAPLPCVVGNPNMGNCPPDTPAGRVQVEQDAATCASLGHAPGSPELAACRERFALQRVGAPFQIPGPMMLMRR